MHSQQWLFHPAISVTHQQTKNDDSDAGTSAPTLPCKVFKAKWPTWPKLSYFGRHMVLASTNSLSWAAQALGDPARSSICYSAFPSALCLIPVLINPKWCWTEPSLNINHCRTSDSQLVRSLEAPVLLLSEQGGHWFQTVLLSALPRWELKTSKVSDDFGVLWASVLVINYPLNEKYFSLSLVLCLNLCSLSVILLLCTSVKSLALPHGCQKVDIRSPSKQVQFPWLPLLISLLFCLFSDGFAPVHQHLAHAPFIQTWMKCYGKLRKGQGHTEARRNVTKHKP